MESKSRILLKRRAPLACAPDPVLRSPLSPFHGSFMSASLRSPSIVAAAAAGARAAGLKLKKRLLD
ncbi:hypothetical protein KDW55_07810 [Burkholderia sp. AU19243]|uniref:hypothetical protein n=1 Tax=Burkholderia TaxID=32008 RepID=UPI000AC844F6|nr:MULTISPECIES: hypothetical protein [Burkholderia]MBR8363226.1 hypothetical protein [Burkholderia sp. AU19243]QTO48148.1 hypothetical protein J8I86_14210 [Burkholderia latens]